MKKLTGVARGLPEQEQECGSCGTHYGVRWVSTVASHYSFSGYLCERCEPIIHPEELKA